MQNSINSKPPTIKIGTKSEPSSPGKYNKSVFYLSFAFELLNIDVWHDCEEGAIELGAPCNGLKVQYSLYPGHTFDVDVIIWPHVAKVIYGSQYGWVRTFQFLQRRWFAFSIGHAFPVRVSELMNYVASVNLSFGLGAIGGVLKHDKVTSEVYIPPLQFNEKRYFGPVVEGVSSVYSFIRALLWKPLIEYIPGNCMDNTVDIPAPVTDIRHQDAIIFMIQELTLNKKIPDMSEITLTDITEIPEPTRRKSLGSNKVKKLAEAAKLVKNKFEIKLSGNAILSGTGRVTLFEVEGETPPSLGFGDVIAMIGSCNLPAHDDVPIMFLNVENLNNIPIEEFKKKRLSHVYVQWQVRDVVYKSEPVLWKGTQSMKMNYHQVVPLPYDIISEHLASFLDEYFRVELRGLRSPLANTNGNTFFGYDKGDKEFGKTVPPKIKTEPTDFLIAFTRIDARTFAKGTNKFMNGDFSLFPPQPVVEELQRKDMCTNDINGIGLNVVPEIVIQPSAILEAEMSFEVSLGMVGCKPQKLGSSYSRLFCKIRSSALIFNIMKKISEINEEIFLSGTKDDLLTGFALDTGDIVFLYAEGPRDKALLRIWEMIEEYHHEITSLFSSSARYLSRLYPEFLLAPMPFNILKMHVSLGVLLACPPVYVRPSLPLPTRAAILKIGRLLMVNMMNVPRRSEMPTAAELRSFRLELCAPPKPIRVLSKSDNPLPKLFPGTDQPSSNANQDSGVHRSEQRTSFSADSKKFVHNF